MCDVAIIFNLLKHFEKQTTLKYIPFDYLSFVIDAIFSELKEIYKLHLKGKKVSILKDFLSCFPYMSDKTRICDILIQVFIDVGMLDANTQVWS